METVRIPDQNEVTRTIRGLYDLLFPPNITHSPESKEKRITDLKLNIISLLEGQTGNREEIAGGFINALENIRQVLLKDAGFIFESDPAAKGLHEVIAIYPGFYAIFCYRMAHFLASKGVMLLPRMITEYAHSCTGIDIHPSAVIGNPFSIDHGTGIVIGETAVIGNYVKMYQGVTIGALSVGKNKPSKKRHPTIEENVILYAGCTILGGETVVGRNSIVGGNVWLTESIPPYSVVYHKGEIIVRNQRDFSDPVNFII